MYLGICRQHGLLIPCVLCGDKPLSDQEKEYKWNGSEHWRELHKKQDAAPEWFGDWLARIPKWRCDCVNKLIPWLAANPPRFGGDWFPWTCDLHNFVNEDLKRPWFSLQDAIALWRPDLLRWKDVDGLRVGFVAACYTEVGGTETFHQTLIPRLSNVVGFATAERIGGNRDTLGVPCASGVGAINSLAAQCDVIVSWAVDWAQLDRPKRLISVHHGSSTDIDILDSVLQGDEIVCVSEATADHLRSKTTKPVHYIPNAADPARIVARNAIDLPAKKLCVWLHRFAADKRPELAIEIARHLPDDWHMVLAGGGQKLVGNDRVTILPPAHPGDLLTRASCFLSTSKFDGFGLSVAEAIEAGVPVVSSPAGIATEPGLATIVEHDASPQEWADAIVLAAAQATRPKLPAEYQLDRHISAWARVVG